MNIVENLPVFLKYFRATYLLTYIITNLLDIPYHSSSTSLQLTFAVLK